MRIYLDNAATSWPKPEAVYRAVDAYQRELGAPAGRGQYAQAIEVGRLVQSCRGQLARLIAAGDPRQIAFAFNGTDALNIALHGLLSAGDHVVTSVIEHNSVLRPLQLLHERLGVEVSYVDCDDEGIIDPAAVAAALRPKTRLVAIAQASNVTGAIQPIAEIGALLRQNGSSAAFLLDAAQSLGHLPIDVKTMRIDLLAAPGHKGLAGPLGTGLLYIRGELADRMTSFRQGGTGGDSAGPQPKTLPEKFESGNLNVVGIVGLEAALREGPAANLADARHHEVELVERFGAGLEEISAVRIHGPRDPRRRVGVVSISIEGYDPQEVAATLDSAFGIQVRAGLHCAPRMHRRLGTFDRGGTIRFSFGQFNTHDHVDQAVAALKEIANS